MRDKSATPSVILGGFACPFCSSGPLEQGSTVTDWPYFVAWFRRRWPIWVSWLTLSLSESLAPNVCASESPYSIQPWVSCRRMLLFATAGSGKYGVPWAWGSH